MRFNYSHFCVSVKNLDESKRFYELFHFSEENRFSREELKVDILYMVNPQGLKLELIQPRGEGTTSSKGKEPSPRTFEQYVSTLGYQHVGFTTDNIEEAYNALKERGARLSGEIKTGKISRYFFCWDPDGNLIEIIQYFA